MTLQIRDVHRPIVTSSSINFSIKRVAGVVDEWPLDLDPDYQRGHVWTEEQRCRFIGHMISGGEVPPCYANLGPDGSASVVDVIDGKQRLTSCMMWAGGEIPAILDDGRQIWYKDLDEESLRNLNGITIQIRFVSLDRQGVLELYLKLNRGGVVHTDEEIERVEKLLDAERGS